MQECRVLVFAALGCARAYTAPPTARVGAATVRGSASPRAFVRRAVVSLITADDTVAPVEDATWSNVEEGEIAKEALKAELGGLNASPDRIVVGEVLLALEAANPTPAPATSELLNGKWKFLYATGASPGLKALQLLLRGSKSAPKSPSGAEIVDVQDTYLTIRSEQPRATSSVKVRLLSFESELRLTSTLEPESAVRLLETYDAAESTSAGLRLPLQSAAQYKRSMLVSYLDDELLVVRDAMGRADVLQRVHGEAGPAADAG